MRSIACGATAAGGAFAAAAVVLLAACGPQPTPSLVDLAEIRGFGDPVVLYDVEKAQHVSDVVRKEIGNVRPSGEAEDAEVAAGVHPYLRVSYFGDVVSGVNKWGRAQVVFGEGGESARVYFRTLDDSTWQRAEIDPAAALAMAEEVERLSGVPLALSVAASAEGLVAVRRAMNEITAQEGLFSEDLSVAEYSPETFPDASLGCPAEGEFYAQVRTPGFRVQIAGPNAAAWDVRVAGEIVRICR